MLKLLQVKNRFPGSGARRITMDIIKLKAADCDISKLVVKKIVDCMTTCASNLCWFDIRKKIKHSKHK